jgi:hypothetical protein
MPGVHGNELFGQINGFTGRLFFGASSRGVFTGDKFAPIAGWGNLARAKEDRSQTGSDPGENISFHGH